MKKLSKEELKKVIGGYSQKSKYELSDQMDFSFLASLYARVDYRARPRPRHRRHNHR